VNLETLGRLRAPFELESIGKLPKVTCSKCADKRVECERHKRQKCRTCKAYVSTEHIHIDFVGHAHVTERLLNVDPDWNWEPMAFTGNGLPQLDDKGGLWIRLTVAGVTRVGYGDGSGPEAVKIAISDAIKNAAMRFGVALDLWKKEAPAPVSDTAQPPTPQPALTPEQRATELRKVIAAVGKKAGKTLDQIGGEFFEWSQGKEISQASVAVLAEYKDFLERNPS
jgi:hypothetical protein